LHLLSASIGCLKMRFWVIEACQGGDQPWDG
jgi:hypothetical protein